MHLNALLPAAKFMLSTTSSRKEKVAHIRFSPEEFLAVRDSAARAGMTVSAFLRSLSLEGAGVQPFFTQADRAILGLLAEDMRAVANNLNQVARAINGGRSAASSDVAARVGDARAIAGTLSAELRSMSRRAGNTRRGEAP
jgi:hypothetical protein